MISQILDYFEENPLNLDVDARTKIHRKYPKFLSKYKLINLQVSIDSLILSDERSLLQRVIHDLSVDFAVSYQNSCERSIKKQICY